MAIPCSNLASAPDRTHPDSAPKGLVFNVMRFSIHDGPGIRTAVFLKGCPLRCWWCHNPEGLSPEPELVYLPDRCILCGDCVAACPHHAIAWHSRPVRDQQLCRVCGTCATTCPAEATQLIGRWLSVHDLIEQVSRDQVFFEESGGGVTFSGGEPFLQAAFLEAALDACRERRIHTAVETCGVVNRDVLLRLAHKIDLFLFDIKVMDRAKHIKYTGAPNDSILANLSALALQHNNIVVRVPVICGVNDDDSNVEEMAHFLKVIGASHLDLLPYHDIAGDKYRRLAQPYLTDGLKVPAPDQIQVMAQRFRRDHLVVRSGG
jgi:pyruvate formate lyase activating enzyme